jgi:hypothetical protein
MNKIHEKWFWFVLMLGSWLLALWVTWCLFGEKTANPMHVLGMVLICFFTTKCYISVNEYD